jgi:hypothetical protein
MKISEFSARMPYYYKAKKSVNLRSAPGRGKSTTIEAAPSIIGEKLGINLGIVIINGAMLTPMDVLGYGLPKHHDTHSEMVFSDPFFWRTREGKRLEEYDGGIIFVDEEDKADVDVKKILGEGALSGRFGPHELPRTGKGHWVVWMAGNRAGDRSGSTKRLDHLINRQMEINLTDDLSGWTDWASGNGVSVTTMTFANQYPQIVFAEEPPKEQGPWCTPRSLVMADEYMRAVAAGNGGEVPFEDPLLIEEVGGMIGLGNTAQFFAMVKLEREMPKFERIVADPEGVKVPDKPDAQMLVAYNLAHRVDKDTAASVITYIERMPKDFSVTFAKSACKRDPKLLQAPAFNKWCMKNASLVASITR